MSFGDLVQPAESVEAGLWIEPACTGKPGTIGDLVPGNFEAVVRVLPPDPESDETDEDYDWWSEYREVFENVVSLGTSHTETPHKAWFAIWDGHGFDNFSTMYATQRRPKWNERRQLKKLRAELRKKDEQDKAEIRKGLAKYPLLKHRIRAYYLMTGPLAAVSGLRYPGPEPSRNDWRNPDMIWPDDQSWIIVTDVDFWSIYIAGSISLINDLRESMPDQVITATWTDELPIEG